MSDLAHHLRGVIVGTAVGDAIGLPREGLSRRRAKRMFGGPPLGHRLVLGRGMVSDDTEHTCMAGQALLASGGDPRAYAQSLAWRLRWWVLGLPAGVGLATARACLKLWIGSPPGKSGVWSAGNGPAMRAAILGAHANNDLELLRELVAASTRLTHTDPAAEHGARAIALAAAYAVGRKAQDRSIDAQGYLNFVRPHLEGTDMLRLIEDVARQVQAGTPLEQYLEDRGLGRKVSGYVNHTVPACLYCWLASPHDFRKVVEQPVAAGGDADSTGAVAGALAGLSAGRHAVPQEWVTGIIDWPRSVAWMDRLADALAVDRQSPVKSHRALGLFWPGVLARNVLFLTVVLIHGLRRVLPRY